MTLIHKLAVFLLFTALAMQGYAAVAMPFCQHQPAQHYASDDHADHGQVQGDLNCDDCASCQLCAAPALPAVALNALPDAAPTLIGAGPISFSLFVPEQPQPPPLSHPV